MHNKIALSGIGIAAMLSVALGAWLFIREGDESELSRNAYPTRGLAFETFNGGSVDIGVYDAPVRIVTSWATWCTFCLEQFSDFRDLKEEFGERIAIIAVNRNEPQVVQESFIAANALLGNGIVFLVDSGDELYRTMGGYDMPETLFLGADDEVLFHKRSVMALEEMRAHTNEALQ